MISFCDFPGPLYFLFSPNIPPLVYYSHFAAIFLSLVFGLFVLHRNRNLTAKVLFWMIITFVAWVALDSIFWASNRSDIIMFVWSLQILFEPLVFVLALYLAFLLIKGRDVGFKYKLSFFVICLPLIILTPTKYFLTSFDVGQCLSIETYWSYYTYVIESVIVIWISIFGIESFRNTKSRDEGRKALFISGGLVLFLLAFASGNIIGSLTGDWNVAQIGLIGTPIFIGFLSYTIVRYRTFSIKVIATQILAYAVWLALLFTLFVSDLSNSRIIIAITLIVLIPILAVLVRGVKREVEQREKIEKLARDLQIANEGQTNLIHVINHQIKGYIAKSRNIFSELLTEPTYGPVSDAAKPMLQEGFNSLTEGVDFVQHILNASNIEKGTLAFIMQPNDFRKILEDVSAKQKIVAEGKGLQYELTIDDGNYDISADGDQIKESVRNLIDNSINYTPTGGIKVHLSQTDKKLLLTIKDTGVGITDDDKNRLFTKGGKGKDSTKINVNSSGYGLSFVKGVIDAHKGRVWAESEGHGKGSLFSVELPLA